MADEQEEGNETELDRALLDFMRRFDAGDIQDRETFLLEYPEIAPQLQTLLDAADLIEKMAGPTLAELANPRANSEPPTGQAFSGSPSEPADPNALTLPPPPSGKFESGRPASISPNDSTLPPQKNPSDFSLTSLGNTSNSQSILPY